MNSQIYQLLQDVASAGKTTSYGEIAPLVGLDMSRPDHRNQMSVLLDQISTHEHEAGRPLLSAVVVHAAGESAGTPGGGFFKMATKLGVQKTRDNTTFFAQELNRVHKHWQEKAKLTSR